ncbi:MAG: cytochrome b/b6 domain-containing protein [Thermoplasmata archaeon]|nr:MAG: cytochrome b/b6 domain-containing protein [Thermoplasmata archaeon]
MVKIKHQDGKVCKFSIPMVLLHWILIIVVTILLITGFIPFFNWVISSLYMYDFSFTELPNSALWHKIQGISFVILVIIYIGLHSKTSDNIISKDFGSDVRSFNNNLMFNFGLVNRHKESKGDSSLQTQKILLILFIYSIGLLMISGIGIYLNSMLNDGTFNYSWESPIFITHILSAFIFLMLVIIFIASFIRKLDWIAIKSILFTGKVPLWYVKKYHRLWYEKILEE